MQTFQNKYKLNILATPIGNLEEINSRFINTINELDILLCEDTRVTKKLLSLLDINKSIKLTKFDMFSEENNLEQIIGLIKDGNKVGLISDAGYPTISDPGYKLLQKCIENNIAINVINGSCSIIHALVGSGISSREFIFLGFIGKSKSERIKKLSEYKNINNTFVIFEAVHRIRDCLQDLYEVFGNQRICIARELTKLHEEFIYDNLENWESFNFVNKGEFVLIIDKQSLNEINNLNIDNINSEIVNLLKQNMKTKEISYLIANKYNLNQKEWYKKIIDIKSEIKKD